MARFIKNPPDLVEGHILSMAEGYGWGITSAEFRMIAKLTKHYTDSWLRAHRTIGRVAIVLFLAGTIWPAEGQWLQDEKAQLPLGQSEKNWTPLASDKVHDPNGQALRQLQEPGAGLYQLPADASGNLVLWAKALDRGAINPRRARTPSGTKLQVLDMDVLMNLRGSFPPVRFPHRIHTQWLACDNCHEHLFKSKIGANPIKMFQILQGEQCGLCHGSVAFPLTQCKFCHSVESKNKEYQKGED